MGERKTEGAYSDRRQMTKELSLLWALLLMDLRKLLL